MSFHALFDAAQHAAPHAHEIARHACHHGSPWGAFAIGAGGLALGYLFGRRSGYRHAAFGYGPFGHHGPHGGCGPHHGHHGFHGHPGWGHGPRGFGRGRRGLRFLFHRLDTTAAQEKVIREAIDEVRDAGQGLRGEGRALRGRLGEAFASETFDTEAFEAAFEGPEAQVRELRGVLTRALAKVHAILTPEQRRELAALLESGPGFFGRRFGRRF